MTSKQPSGNAAERIGLSDDIEEVLAERNQAACCQAVGANLLLSFFVAIGRSLLRRQIRPASDGIRSASRAALTPSAP
jgi:hypothetical protein